MASCLRRLPYTLYPRLPRIGQNGRSTGIWGLHAYRFPTALATIRASPRQFFGVNKNSIPNIHYSKLWHQNLIPKGHLRRRNLFSSSKPEHQSIEPPLSSSPSPSSSSSPRWSERLQNWASRAATSASRGATRIAQGTDTAVVSASKRAVLRFSTGIVQASRHAAQRLTINVSAATQQLTSSVRARVSNLLDRTTASVSHGVKAAAGSFINSFRVLLVEPIQRNGTRLGWWGLAAIAVYGIATTVPREITRHLLEQRANKNHEQQPKQEGKD